jgi:hypothetical protein
MRLAPLQKQIIDFRFLIYEFEAIRDQIRNHVDRRRRNVNNLDNFAVIVLGLKIAASVASSKLRKSRMRETMQSASCAV